jgi:hypothetical protein
LPLTGFLLLTLSGLAAADDRDFFRGSGGGAYVMMLLDVSGSMTWTTTEGAARASGDGPDSKLYLAKSAVYEVIQGSNPSIRLGFAHFRQANHEYRQKRWLYKRAETKENSEDPLTDADLPWFTAIPFPPAGMPIDIGNELVLDGNSQGANPRFDTDFIFPQRTTANIPWHQKKDRACESPDTNNAPSSSGMTNSEYRLWRMAVYPKLGPEGANETVMYTRRGTSTSAKTYEITLLPLTGGEKPYAPTVFTRSDGSEELRINVRFKVREVRWVGSSSALGDEAEEDMVLAANAPAPAATPPALSVPAPAPAATPVAVPVGVDVTQVSELPDASSGGVGRLAIPLAVPVGADLGRMLPLGAPMVAQAATATRTRTPTPSRTPTRTRTPSRTPTSTRTLTPSRTPTRTLSPTASRTPTRTGTPTSTRTPSRTATATATRTVTLTPSITPTRTATRTATVTRTPSATPPPGNDCATIAGPWEFTIPMVPFYEEDLSTPPIPLSGVSDYIGYHDRAQDMFNIGETGDYLTDETCEEIGTYGSPYYGEEALWEPNGNTASDGIGAYETFADPYARDCAHDCLDRGDVVPWDWRAPDGSPGFEQTNRTEILWRLAPNLSQGETIPDFRVARYMKDTKTGGTAGRLQLEDAYNPALRAGGATRYPPISARALTPLGGMLDNFSQWYDDWEEIATDPVKGDPSWDCMQRYAILLTDGAETCGTDGPAEAQALREKGVRVFAVGFGSGVTSGDLEEIADNGGTGSVDTDGDGLADCLQFNTCTLPITAGDGVIIADNRDELVEALKGIFSVVNLETATFATAAVPTAENSTQDSIALTSFLPLADSSVWPGTVNHFVQPIPFVVDGQGLFRPDPSVTCNQTRTTGCLAWEAGARLLQQAPDPTEVLSDRQIGELPLERRVTYSQAAAGTVVPRSIRPFDYPAAADEFDLWNGFGLPFTQGNPTSEAAARTAAEQVIRRTLETKTVTDPRVPDGSLSITYILGDSLHGEPVFLSQPEQFFYLANDLEGNGSSCTDTVNPNRGYRCFFERNQRRRQVLLLNSNDGQVHAFDAGTFDPQIVGGQLQGEFDPGTGNEIWSHITRPMLSHVKQIATVQTQHEIGADGAMWADDVFIDPAHSGVPDPDDREWRTVVLGGYREGASGYFAMDVTQPDPLDIITVKNFAGVSVERFVPRIGSDYVPTCNTAYNPTQCGPLPYPSVLWEFDDACDGTTPCAGGLKDEDDNDHPDLGFTWSKPNTGRIRVMVGTTEETRFVAIFGGGMNPTVPNESGNFLYMVDIETGQTLYKRVLDGSAPSEPAAVDSDQNGFLDTVYIGTTMGFMYKVDVSAPGTIDGSTGRIETSQWTPLKIFDTLLPDERTADPTGGRPIFYPPTVLFASELGHYALAFGTGNRENLWEAEVPPEAGRFYTILDFGFNSSTTGLPFTEASYQVIAKTDGNQSMDLLVSPLSGQRPGWVMHLDAGERVVTEAFALEGLLSFNSFVPSDGDPQAQGCEISAGEASIYTLLSTNGNPLGPSGRTRTVAGLASSPYVMPASVSQTGFQGSRTDPFTAAEIQGIRENLKDLYPDNCAFGNFALRVAANISTTAQFAVAEVPVCVVVKNWKEF